MTTKQPATLLIHPERAVPGGFRSLVPGTERASTVLFENIDKWKNRSASTNRSTPTAPVARPPRATCKSPRRVGRRVCHGAVPSGLAAVAYAFLPFVAPGDHVLIPANVYDPVKTLANGLLKRMNVTVEQYDPLVGAGIAAQIKPNTKLVWVETPGSITMEVSDLPAIAAAAHAAGGAGGDRQHLQRRLVSARV